MILMRILPLILFPVVLAGCHKQKPAPSIDELSAALRRSAEQSFPTPSLADQQVILHAKPGQVEGEAGAVLAEVSAAGGQAIRGKDAPGQVSIFATVPEINADALIAALRSNEKRTWEKPASSSARVIDIFIKESAAASPSP
jgi:hypothetical protein